MKIQRLPEELAAPPATPPVVDPLLLSTPPQTEKFVTGVRPPPPPPGRRHSLRGATPSPGVTMEIDRSCTLLVCFHDDAASTSVQGGDSDDDGAGGPGGAAELAHQASSSSVGGSQLNLPKWATRIGLNRTNMHVRRLEKYSAERVYVGGLLLMLHSGDLVCLVCCKSRGIPTIVGHLLCVFCLSIFWFSIIGTVLCGWRYPNQPQPLPRLDEVLGSRNLLPGFVAPPPRMSV